MDRIFNFQGKRIGYSIEGQGNAIILLHGFIESRKIWNDFLKSLSQEFTVLTIDFPGHGESEVISEVHSMTLMAEVVKAVMNESGISVAVVVGHSMGGYVALELARMFPEALSGLVLFHSKAAPDSEETKENRRRTIDIVRKNRAGFIRQFIPDLFDQRYVGSFGEAIARLVEDAGMMSQEGIIAALSGMRDRAGGLDYLTTTELPVLFIIGKQDSRIPYAQVLAQAILPSHSEVLLLDRVGHMGYIEAPETTLQAIRHFAMKCFES